MIKKISVSLLDVGNFWDKSTETALHEICMKFFLDFPIPESNAYPYR